MTAPDRAGPTPNPVPPPDGAAAQTAPQVDPAARPPRGPWRTLAHGAPGFAITVVANAAVQALLVALEPDLALSLLGVLLAALSAASLLAASVVVWRAAARETGGSTSSGVGALVVRCAVVGALAALAAVLLPYLVPIVIALGCALVAAGGFRPFSALAAQHPVRLTALAVVTAIVVVLIEIVALLVGLFVTGWPAAAATWLAAGIAAAILISHWQSLAARPSPRPRGAGAKQVAR